MKTDPVKLQTARVRSFRNVIDSGDIAVTDHVTCLVGKNESGKTAILQALQRLNPATPDVSFDISAQYPRWRLVADRRAGLIEQVAPVEATFLLEEEDLQHVEAVLGPDVVVGDTVRVTVSYANQRDLEVEVDARRALDNLYESLQVPEDLQTQLQINPPALANLRKAIQQFQETEAAASWSVLLTAMEQEAASRLQGANTEERVTQLLLSRLPLFFYFSDYQFLPGRIDVLELAGTDLPGQSNLQTARALLQLAGTTAEALTGDDFEERVAELEAVSNDLTTKVFEYWKQNEDLSVQIQADNSVDSAFYPPQIRRFLDIRVKDGRHGFTNNFDQRSNGFRWFFSFLAAFSEFEGHEHGVVVLLDEPALTLHGKAQADFLRYIGQELADAAQVVYTTHSPFMVDATALDRVRVVEDQGPKIGAVVSTEVLTVGSDSLFPLQAALGYDIAQNLYVGPDNLLVEGTSDYTYFELVSSHLTSLGRTGLDLRWRILPTGGGTNVPAFVALIGPTLDVTVIIDGSPSVVGRLSNLSAQGLLETSRIFVLDRFTGKRNSDVEDLFDPEDYLILFNRAFGTELAVSDLHGTDRVVAQIGRVLGHDFTEHGKPANVLLQSYTSLLPQFSESTLQRFEELFRAVNKSLSAR